MSDEASINPSTTQASRICVFGKLTIHLSALTTLFHIIDDMMPSRLYTSPSWARIRIRTSYDFESNTWNDDGIYLETRKALNFEPRRPDVDILNPSVLPLHVGEV
jgi:hypothetical protein